MLEANMTQRNLIDHFEKEGVKLPYFTYADIDAYTKYIMFYDDCDYDNVVLYVEAKHDYYIILNDGDGMAVFEEHYTDLKKAVSRYNDICSRFN